MNIHIALRTLHYSDKWLQYDFIDEQTLDDQLQAFKADCLDSPEHYRFETFNKILNTFTPLDDLTIEHFIELAELDEDKTMAQAALGLLAGHKYLTQEQLSSLKEHSSFQNESLHKIINRVLLLRNLDTSGLTNELVQRCISVCDVSVQRKLLNRQDISREHLESLSISGTTRAIKNLAKQKLRSFP